MYKETNGAEWVDTPLYKSDAIFVCVSVDQVLISKEKEIYCPGDGQILDFPSLSKNHLFIGAFRNPYPS